jgi:beta-N-acetylhexosaminidase
MSWMRSLLVAAASVSALCAPAASVGAERSPTLMQLLGQHLLVRMQGSVPSPSFLGRIRRGEIGGVVIFGNNGTEATLPALVAKLQAAASSGGQLPLLIATDQEGGEIKRLPGPPSTAPSGMPTASAARSEGLATARYLRRFGINADLAPVLDVPAGPRAFVASRAFGSTASVVASHGVAFAQGLVAGGVAATAKHFPGLGRLTTSTDYAPTTVISTRTALARDLIPFTHAIAAGVPAVMVGTAIYPAYGDDLPAACSPSVVTKLLHGTLHFSGVTMSDDLDTAGVWSRISPPEAAVQAVKVGIDMVYIAGVNGSGGDAIGEHAFSALMRAATAGRLSPGALQASYSRIAALKRRYVRP